MSYFVKFQSGNELTINREQYEAAMRHEVKDVFINLANVDYIVPATQIENPSSGVIRPQSPQDLRNKAEQDRLKRIANPQALIADIRQKAEPDHEKPEDNTMS